MCDLCDLHEKRQVITRLYHEDDVVIVVDCRAHNIPMVVLKRHSAYPEPWEARYMVRTWQHLFPNLKYREPRSILDHYHIHAE